MVSTLLLPWTTVTSFGVPRVVHCSGGPRGEHRANQLLVGKVWGRIREQTYKEHSAEDTPKPFPFSSTYYEGCDHTRCLCGQIPSRYTLETLGIRMSGPEATWYTKRSVVSLPPQLPRHTNSSGGPISRVRVSYARTSNCTRG